MSMFACTASHTPESLHLERFSVARRGPECLGIVIADALSVRNRKRGEANRENRGGDDRLLLRRTFAKRGREASVRRLWLRSRVFS
jgi:hypothetical protein